MLRLSLVALILLAGHARGQGFGGFGGGNGFGGMPAPPPPFVPDNPFAPPPAAPPQNSAETRRAARDQVMLSVGPEALAFTKRFADLGIAALQQVSPETGKKLVALFNNGQLARLKNPQAALEAIRLNGDLAAVFLCDNIGKLADPEALECWCRNPMDFVYDLKDIEVAADELRARRKLVPPWLSRATAEWPVANWVFGGLAILLLLWWRRSRQTM